MFKLVGAEVGNAQDKIVDEMITVLEKEIEPLLHVKHAKGGAGPYYGGSGALTLVEVMTAPFVIRMRAFSNDIIFPSSLKARMDGPTMPTVSACVKVAITHPSVTYTWDEEYLVPRIIERLPAAKAKYAPGGGK